MNTAAPTLARMQQDFAQHLLAGHDRGADDIRRAISPGGIGIERRLHIYHNAYRMRLLDTLRDSYGHTLLYLGDEAFNSAGLAFIEGHGSSLPSLRWYGPDFPAFLQQRLRDEPEAAELATLDWTLRHAFDGADATPLTLSDMAALPPEAWGSIGFVLHPTAARLQLHFNTLALWQAVDQEQDAPPAATLAQPGELLVWRRGHQPHFRSLGAVEAAAIVQLQAGASFADLCAALAQAFPEQATAEEAGALLRRWVEEELLCGFTGV